MEQITEKDRQLIKEAESLCCTQWDEAYDLAERADTETARERIKDIARYLYHYEEDHISPD